MKLRKLPLTFECNDQSDDACAFWCWVVAGSATIFEKTHVLTVTLFTKHLSKHYSNLFFSCIAERARSLVGQLRGKLLQKKVKPVTARVFTSKSSNQKQKPNKKHTQHRPKQTKHNTASENSQKVKLNAPPQAPHFISSTM